MPEDVELIEQNLTVVCEAKYYEPRIREFFKILKSVQYIKAECRNKAYWVLVFDTDVCENHEHMVLLCREHLLNYREVNRIKCSEDIDYQKVSKVTVRSITQL